MSQNIKKLETKRRVFHGQAKSIINGKDDYSKASESTEKTRKAANDDYAYLKKNFSSIDAAGVAHREREAIV